MASDVWADAGIKAERTICGGNTFSTPCSEANRAKAAEKWKDLEDTFVYVCIYWL